MTPRVSIGLVVRNCGKTLGMTMASVFSQTDPRWEMILIDDGSVDDTPAVAAQWADPRVRVISDGKPTGLAARLNQAVAASRGRYFARMDGDDIAYPERIETQLRYLTDHPDTDLLASRVMIFQETGGIVGTYPFRETHEDICRKPWAGFYFPHPAWMGKTEWFMRHPYRFDAKRMEDQDLLLRTFSGSRFHCLSQILLGYRQERLSLQKILTGRLHFSIALARNPSLMDRSLILRGIAAQGVKAMADGYAVAFGFNYRLLRHRALPVTEAEAARWEAVSAHLKSAFTERRSLR